MREITFKDNLPKPNSIAFVLWLLLNYVFINTAFINEDAFITFRVVDNLIDGFGPVWNIGEKVQVYTHPLWYFLLSAGVLVFKNPFWVSIGLSYICLNLIFLMLMKINSKVTNFGENKAVLHKNYIVLFILPLSRSFVDYSSSGLENPLIHILLCIYFFIFICDFPLTKKFFWSNFVFGLIFLSRPDAIFMVTPASLFLLYKIIQEKKISFSQTLLSILPVLIWEIFSVIYYGSPIPNTALAKTNIDYTFLEIAKNSLIFFSENFKNDILTSSFIIIAIVLGLLNNDYKIKLFSLGLVLQQVYFFKVGGDYMLGRFFSSSILLSVLILLTINFSSTFYPKVKVAFILILVLLIIPSAKYTLYPAVFVKEKHIKHGISDVRTYYYKNLGMLSVLYYFKGDYTLHPWAREGEKYRDKKLRIIIPNIGMMPWSAGKNMYWTDELALSEPFLARLPAMQQMRIGHYKRAIPDGYYQTIMTGENHIKSRKLANLYDDVSLAVHDEIWTTKRWRAIWRLNTGFYKNLDKEFDRNSRIVNKR